ncbi:hypothetical protein B0T10DRAFT_436777 [Thelonectria olida]|uniref:Uncharacterized protein n=1 Tax=Thelonectria olida TaxID=1576542 RepID=A0A9P9AUP7_9HYPO|nr:hypothetical protein B0T10DRAFT_436777 [Thelonectria olida]
MADSEDVDSKLQQFAAMCDSTPEEAREYLEAHNWDLNAACTSWFEDADEDGSRQQPQSQAVPDDYTGPRTLDGRPAPQAGPSSSAARKPASQPKKKGIATLGSLGGGAHHHDDDDDDDDMDGDDDEDGRGNLFAGGEKSGLAVQDPNQEGGSKGGSKKIISDILAKARANAARANPESEAGPSVSSFRGTGMTLGGEGAESRSIPDPHGPVRPDSEIQQRVLHLWQDGFSIGDGELHSFDDPRHQFDLSLIRSGRAPLHLMNVQQGQQVDVKLHQHDEPYKPQPKQYRPFGGEGRRLGSPVPGDGSEATTSLNTAVSTTAASDANPAPTVNDSQPTLTIRIQMPDGTRLPARFNTTHTLDDVYGFVQGASADTRARPWVLATTFPNKEHTDRSLVLGDIPEFKKGGTAVVKWT